MSQRLMVIYYFVTEKNISMHSFLALKSSAIYSLNKREIYITEYGYLKTLENEVMEKMTCNKVLTAQ